MFKVGDRVKCVKVTPKYYDYPPIMGRIYTVFGISHSIVTKESLWIFTSQDLSWENAFCEEDFVLAVTNYKSNCGKFRDSTV